MDGQGKEGIQLSPINPTKPAATLALKNFTIPRKKRVSGQVLLEPCPEESRDYSLIQSKLREARLDMRKEHANAWLWRDVKLVHNEEFLKEFSEKRSEMRTKGRHGREMEERFCFMVASHETTNQIYQHGLRTETQDQNYLGKSSHGVYLFRHVDVALKHATTSMLSEPSLIVFKVLFGKVKKITPSLDWNRTPDPTVAFDCHMSKDTVSYRESLFQQVLGSSVFLFDYSENQELNKRPRQCLPYAVVLFVPAFSTTPPTSISPPVSPTKHPTGLAHGSLDRLRGCTVAKRRGKGENAKVTFKHFATQSCVGPDYTGQNHGLDPPLQHNDLQNPLLVIPPPLYMPLYQTAGYYNPSLPYVDSSLFQNCVPLQNYPDESAFPSVVQHLNTTSTFGSNTENCSVTPQTSTENISTIVYSSRLVKDPRLSRQETNTENKGSEKEKANIVSECDELRCQRQSQEGKAEFSRSVSYQKQSLEVVEGQSKDCCPKPSQDGPQEPESSLCPKTRPENMPSIKLFKMKFQKYAAYFKMSEEERHQNVWSQKDLTAEQKQSLMERIHYYETYYQKYRQGLLFQKDTKTENGLSVANAEPRISETCLTTVDKSPVKQESTGRRSVTSDVSDLIAETLFNTERPTADMFNTDNENVRNNRGESTLNILKENEQNLPPGSPEQSEETQDKCVAQLVGKPCISKQSPERGPLLQNASEETEATESTAEFKQCLLPICPSEQGKVNPSAVRESKCSTILNESTLSTDIEEDPKTEFKYFTAKDTANFADISVSESYDLPSAAAMRPDPSDQKSTNNEEEESFIRSEPEESSEMSIEVKRGELRQDNTIHSALYNRLQFLPFLHGASTSSNKSYLQPKDLHKIPCVNQLYSSANNTMSKEDCSQADCGENLQFIVRRKSNQATSATAKLTLSERFSKLRSLNRKLMVLDHEKVNNNTSHLTGNVTSDLGGLSLSSDGDRRMNNVKLIQILAQRFNKTMSQANYRHLKGKHSKVLSRKTTTVSLYSLIHSAQLPTCVRALRRRKRNLCKAMNPLKKKYFSRTLQRKSTLSACPPVTKEALDSNKVSNSCNSSTESSSCDLQSHDRLEHSRDNLTNISNEEHSCLNTSVSGNTPSNDDELSHITTSKKQSTEIICELVSGNLSICDTLELQGEISVDVKDLLITDEIEPEKGTNNRSICIQKKPSPITCPDTSESNSDGEIAKAEHKAQATSQAIAESVEKDKCSTEKMSTDYNRGTYEDKSDLVETVSSIPCDMSSGNMIISCTSKAQTTTSDLPTSLNNDERGTEKEKETLCDGAMDKARGGVIKSVVDILANVSNDEKVGEMEESTKIQNSDLCSLANSTEVNTKLLPRPETSDDDQRKVKSAQEDIISHHVKLNYTSEPASKSDSTISHTQSSTIISHLEVTPDLHNKVIKDANKLGITAVTDNLQPAWQGQDKNNLPSTETQLISKLREYLTKIECTVRRQEPVNVNNSVKDSQVPMAWITLDSTLHKQQLFDINRLDLAHLRQQGTDFVSTKKGHTLDHVLPSNGKCNVIKETVNSSVASTKRKISTDSNPPKSNASKMKRKGKLARVSPDSTSMLEPVQNDTQPLFIVNKDMDKPPIPSSLPNLPHWLPNHGSAVQQNNTIHSQGLVNPNLSSAQKSQGNLSAEKPTKVNEQTLYEKKSTYAQKEYSISDISSTLKLADHAVSVVQLSPLQIKCKSMLKHFISNFEQDQNVSFNQFCISRSLVLEKYLDHPPAPVEIKFQGLNSFLELQMMVETSQFVENKINFLSGKPTFRSLLWYDPSLYGELYKGAVGFQQQSSLFSSFQQCLANEGYSKLEEYYTAVSTLHQQLQDAPDTSYYMYLKSKRERLEIEAALRNPPDIKSFFLSVPVALMMNFGNNLESLEKAHRTVITFIETPSDRLPGIFDVGKAEHLSIICRYLQEKITFLKSREPNNKVAWFGIEHLLYDASKLLVWRETEQGISNEVLLEYKRSNPQIVYGVTETGIALVNRIEQPGQPVERGQITAQQQMNTVRNYRNTQSGISTERAQTSLGIQAEDPTKATYQPTRRRATHPPVSKLNDVGVTTLVQPSLPAQLGKTQSYSASPQQSNAAHWRMAENHIWDLKLPGIGQTSESHPEIRALLLSKRRTTIPCTEPKTDIKISHAVRQQQWPPPFIINPRVTERINHHTELRKEQANEATVSLMQPFPHSTTTVMPPPISQLPFSNTLNQIAPHGISTQINYPYFIFNGQTYAVAPSVPRPTLNNDTQYHPHPV
ncbi:uncharacterized protein purg isoform X1 [Hoplias malabaricus]|uniref:uncharacterized protein purg isoform X1 n=1 Tax=Hoplias malabaricus TaxID=27720 RepID=UPI003461F4D6